MLIKKITSRLLSPSKLSLRIGFASEFDNFSVAVKTMWLNSLFNINKILIEKKFHRENRGENPYIRKLEN